MIEYLLFVGLGLYLAASVMFFLMFLRTLRTKDGVGLQFLRYLTLGNAIGAFTIFFVRYSSEYGTMDVLTARAIAIINPIVLISTALYLNYLFHQRWTPTSKIIKEIKKDTTVIKTEIKKL